MAVSNDVKRGREALVYFHNEALKYPENYSLSFQELVDTIQGMTHGQFLDGFGFAINSADLNEAQIKQAMMDLADKGQGKIPAHPISDFFNALVSPATQINFIDAVKETAASTATDIAHGLEQVGGVAVDTLKNAGSLVTLVPFVAFAGLAFWLYLEAKHHA